jgi:hypothetical protein
MTVPVLILVVLIVAFGAEVGWLAGADGWLGEHPHCVAL